MINAPGIRLVKTDLATWIVAVYLLTFAVALPVDISLAVLLAGLLLTHRELPVPADRSMLAAVTMFIAVVVLCSVLSYNPRNSFLYSVTLVPALILFYLLKSCRKIEDRHLVLLCLMLALLYQAAKLLFANTAGSSNSTTPADIVTASESLLIIVPNDVVLFVLTLPFALYLFQSSTAWQLRVISAGFVVVTLLLAVWLQSRLSVLTMLVVIPAYFLLCSKKIPWKLASLTLCAVIMADALMGLGLITKLTSFSDSRLPLWNAAWSMFLQEPINGYGPHMYGEYYKAFFVTEGYGENIVVDMRHTPWPHNLYLELLAEYGLIGFFAFIGLVIVAARRLIQQLGNASGDETFFLSAVAASSAGFLLAALIELTLLRLWVVVYLFMLLSFISYLKVDRSMVGAPPGDKNV